MNNKDILKQQLKKYLKALDELKITANNKSKKEHIRQASIIQDVYDFCIKDIIKQFLTNFYYKILKEEQKSKILAIEKKMLKDKSFIDELVELRVKAERDIIKDRIQNYEYDKKAHQKGKCSHTLAICSTIEQEIKMELEKFIKP